MRGRLRRRGCENRVPNAFDISQHVVIPESQNAITVIRKPLIADGITRVSGMLAAIDFNDDAVLSAYEVDDIGADWLLTDELNPESARERRYFQSLRSPNVDSLRRRLAEAVFVTFALRMRQGPLTPPSPRARGEGVASGEAQSFYRATIGCAASTGSRGVTPENIEPSSNHDFGAGWPHSVWRCGSRATSGSARGRDRR